MSHPRPNDEAHEARAVALAAARRGEGTYHRKWAKRKHWLDLTAERDLIIIAPPATPFAELAVGDTILLDSDDPVAHALAVLDQLDFPNKDEIAARVAKFLPAPKPRNWLHRLWSRARAWWKAGRL